MNFNFFDALGLLGVVLIVGNYAWLQMKREYAKRLAYSSGNFLGSFLVTLSLIDKWNLSAFVVNAVMALISLYGVYRCLKYKVRRFSQAAGAQRPVGDET